MQDALNASKLSPEANSGNKGGEYILDFPPLEFDLPKGFREVEGAICPLYLYIMSLRLRS